jgi:hypothetical protein
MAELSNPQWERFCQELLKDDCQTQAYIRAGYRGRGAERSAHRLIRRPEVAARVAELRTKRNRRIAEEAGITQDWVVTGLLNLLDRAKDKDSLAQARLTYGMLGKQIGMWPTRPDTAGKTVTLSDLIAKAYKPDDPDPAP